MLFPLFDNNSLTCRKVGTLKSLATWEGKVKESFESQHIIPAGKSRLAALLCFLSGAAICSRTAASVCSSGYLGVSELLLKVTLERTGGVCPGTRVSGQARVAGVALPALPGLGGRALWWGGCYLADCWGAGAVLLVAGQHVSCLADQDLSDRLQGLAEHGLKSYKQRRVRAC